MTEDDLDRLAAAGVYAPAQDDAAAQRVLLERLLTQGLTIDELTAAHRLGNLVLRSFGHLIQPGARRTLDEVVVAAGIAPEVVLRIRRAWGFPDPAPGERCFTDADVETLGFFRTLTDLVGPELTLQTARAVGAAVSRIAEAQIALVRSRLEAPAKARGEGGASVLIAYANVLETLLPATLRAMDTLFRAHLVHLGRLYVAWAPPPSALNVVDMVVGFADLTGSTALVQRADLAGLDRAITRFEEVTSDLIACAGATLVKRLGDGVMFVIPRPEAGFELALGIVDAFRDAPDAPAARVGLAVGRVAALRGDFYGPPVHLAARLADLASPATVLVAPGLFAMAAGRHPGLAFTAMAPQRLAGFDEPIAPYALRRR